MQFRPTFCLWMEPGNPAEVLEAFRRRWQKEPFAGAAHVFVEPAGAFLKLSDDEWHRRVQTGNVGTGQNSQTGGEQRVLDARFAASCRH